MPPDEINELTANQKIESGLTLLQNKPSQSDEAALLESLKDFSDPVLEQSIEVKFSLNDLAELQTLSDSRAAKIESYVTGALKHMENKEKEASEYVADLNLQNPTERARIFAERIRDDRTKAINTGKAEREVALSELAELHKKASVASEFYRSPQQFLTREALGDPRALQFQQQVQGAGYAELRHLCMLATATKNIPLGWACLTQLEGMPKASRPFSPQALALALVRNKFRQGLIAIMTIKNAYLSASRKNRELVTGNRTSTGKIESGLRTMALNKMQLDRMKFHEDGSVS